MGLIMHIIENSWKEEMKWYMQTSLQTAWHIAEVNKRWVFRSLCLRHSQSLSCVWVFATPWTVAQQAPLSMGFFRQEHWSVLPFPFPWDLPNLGIKPESSTLAGGFFTTQLGRSANPLYPCWCRLRSKKSEFQAKGHLRFARTFVLEPRSRSPQAD